MPVTKKSRGRAVKAKRGAGRPKRRTAKKVPAKVTYGELQRLLRQIKKWWTKVDGDVRAVEGLIASFSPKEVVAGDVKQKLKKLTKKVRDKAMDFPRGDYSACVQHP